MKFTVDQNAFWRGIDTVLDAVASKPAQPVLSNLMISVEDGALSLYATDLDLSMRTRVEATVSQPGRVTVPAKTLADITREWPEAELHVVVEEGRLVLSGRLGSGEGGDGRYSLAVTPADEFPNMPESIDGVVVDFTGSNQFDGQLLRTMIDRTSFSVSKDETRPVLNGVLWRIDPEFMAMVATDGSRLAESRQQLSGDDGIVTGESAEVIMPPQICSQLAKLLSGGSLNRAIVGDSQVLFDLGETQLLSRLIEGPYVDYEQVVPKDNDKRLSIDIERLLPAVRRVSILSSSYTHQIRLKMEQDTLELTASSQELGGDARETIPAGYTSEDLDVAYNAQYLLEILRKLGSGAVVFELRDSVTASIVRPGEAHEDGSDFYYLLMPMRPSG